MSALCQSRLRPRGSTASATACNSGVGEVARQSELVREDPAHVGVHRGHVLVVGEDEDGARRVRADAGERAQAVGRARQLRRAAVRRGGDGRRRALLQPPRPVVVAEALPAPEHVGERRRGEALERRPHLEPFDEARRHPGHLRLLQHDLADQDGVGVGGAAPRQVAPVVRVPREQALLQRTGASRGRRGEAPAGLMCRARGGPSPEA